MLTLDELYKFLIDNNSDFEIIEHEKPIITVEDAKKYFDVEKSTPTLILKNEKSLIALIVSSQRGRIDFKELAQKLGYLKLKMADREEVFETTHYHSGAIPFIGHDLPCIFDNCLLAYDYIYGGSGDELHTLKIAPQDVIRLNNVVNFID